MADLKLKINKRERLADQLYGQLLEGIVSGQLQAGDKLPSENQISRTYDVSRPVIREALLRLQADGLVYSRQGAGSFVKSRPPAGLIQFAAPSDVAGLLRCFEARLPFEGAAASLAAQRATPEDVATIESTFRELELALEGEQLADEADFAFHMAIARATQNEFFVNILSSLNSSMIAGMRVALSISKRGSPERVLRIIEEHRAIVTAISVGDSTGADLSMRYHIYRARARVTDHLNDQ